MPRITFREFFEINCKEEDFEKINFKEIIDLSPDNEGVFKIVETEDNKLSSVVYEFARTYCDDVLYQRVLHQRVSVIVDGKVKHPDIWPYIWLDKDSTIIITPIFGKGFLKILIGVVLIVVGIILYSTPWGVPLILAGAGMIIGAFAEMLFAPDLPQIGDTKETKTYSWSGIRSLVRTGVPVPIIIGTHKVGGYIVGLYTKSIGDESYLYMLLAMGEGEVEGLCQYNDNSNVCTTSNQSSADYKVPAIFINDQPMLNYNDVNWWFRNGTNLEDATKDVYDPTAQNPIPYFNDVRIQYDDGRSILSEDLGGTVYTTNASVDRVEISLQCPQLFSVNKQTGGYQDITVLYKMEYKKSTEDDDQYVTHYPSRSRCSSMCNYFTVDDFNVENCLLGGTANSADCSRSNQVCSFGTGDDSKYQDQVFVKTVLYYNGSEYFTGLNRPTMIRARLESYIDEDVTSSWRYYDPTTRTMTYKQKRKFTFKLFSGGNTSTCILEMLSIITNFWIEDPTIEYGWPPGGYYTPAWGWPETCQFDFGGFTVTLENLQNLPIYNPADQTGSSEFVFYSELLEQAASEWGIIKTRYNRDPVYQWDEIDFGDERDCYDIRISRDLKPSEDTYSSNDLKLAGVSEIISDSLIYPNTALLAFSMRATEQLSGSPPNVTNIIKGVKVEVPTMKYVDETAVNFEDAFWNDDEAEWQDKDGVALTSGLVSTWDNSTLEEQYTENFAAHLRNIILNKRYGIGRKVNSNDINFNSWVSVLKDCHIAYNPHSDTAFDFASWWIDATDSQWGSKITIPLFVWPYFFEEVERPRRTDVVNRKIICETTEHWNYGGESPPQLRLIFTFDLYKKLEIGRDYILEITFESSSQTLDLFLELMGYAETQASGQQFVVLEQTVTITANKISVSFTANGNLASFEVKLGANTTVDFECIVTDISLVQDSVKHFHEANGIMESRQNADTLLGEMCRSFRCWLIALSKDLHLKLDKDETPIHTISATNIVDGSFSQSFTPLSSIPYVLEAQFSDSQRAYELNTMSAIVPLVEVNKASKKTIGLKYLTDNDHIARELKYNSNCLALNNHLVSFKLEMDYLHAAAGDLVRVEHPLPNWGSGQSGRVIAFTSGVSITIDKDYTFDDVSSYQIMYQTSVNATMIATITNTDEDTNVITLDEWPVTDPFVDSAYVVGKINESTKAFRLLATGRDKDNYIQCMASLHTPSVFDLSDIKIIEQPTQPPLSYTITITSFSVTETGVNPDNRAFSFSFTKTGILVESFDIQMSSQEGGPYTTVMSLPGSSRAGTVYMGHLIPETMYYFRIQGRSTQAVSLWVYANCWIGIISLNLEPPNGLRILGKEPNESTFNTRDITFTWTKIALTGATYFVEIYKDSITYPNLMSEKSIADNQFTYSLSENMNDNDGTPFPVIVVRVASIDPDDQGMSGFSIPLTVTNSVPDDIVSVSTNSVVGGARFSWVHSTGSDHKCYYIRCKVGADFVSIDDDGLWFESDTNEYSHQLTESDITTYGPSATIYFEAKDKDWYEQLSATAATANISASVITDSLFAMIVTASDGSGSLPELYDGVLDTGGWIIGA